MNEYMDCYFTGVTFAYQPVVSQELRVQVTDNRIGSMEDAYGLLPAGIEKPRAPLFYTFNWNSCYLDEVLNLRYSATAGEQAKGKWMYMAWAGHNVCTGPFDGYFDVMYTRGSLDPLGILTELVPPSGENEEGPVCLRNVQYLSLVAEMNYRFHPKGMPLPKACTRLVRSIKREMKRENSLTGNTARHGACRPVSNSIRWQMKTCISS